MTSIKYHYLCINNLDFLLFGVVSVFSLIKCGVSPTDIIVSVDEGVFKGQYCRDLETINVCINVLPPSWGSKVFAIDIARRKWPADIYVQIDCDTVFKNMECVNKLIEDNISISPVSYFECNVEALQTFSVRSTCYHSGFCPKEEAISEYNNLINFFELAIGCDINKFRQWLKNDIKIWLWGTVFIISSSIFSTEFWRTARAYDIVSRCDETIFYVSKFKTGLKTHFINNFQHKQVSNLKDDLDSDKTPRLIHYAGIEAKKISLPYILELYNSRKL